MLDITRHILVIPFYIRYADTYPVLLPVLLCLFKQFRVPREITIIFWLSLSCGIINFIGNQIGQRHINNEWTYHLYAVITFIITSFYFASIAGKQYVKHLNGIITVLFIFFSIVNILLWQGLKDFNSNGFGIMSILFIIYSIFFYYQQLKETENLFIEKSPNFWIVTGIFFYYTGDLFLFFVYNHIIDYNLVVFSNLPSGPFIIHQIMFTILMICFSIGIFLCKTSRQIYPV